MRADAGWNPPQRRRSPVNACSRPASLLPAKHPGRSLNIQSIVRGETFPAPLFALLRHSNTLT